MYSFFISHVISATVSTEALRAGGKRESSQKPDLWIPDQVGDDKDSVKIVSVIIAEIAKVLSHLP